MSRGKPSSKALSKEHYVLLAEFRYRLRKFLGFSEAAAISHGVSPQQYQAMLAIQGFPGRDWVTVGELAEKMQVAHHSAGGLARRMERLGLVAKSASAEDRRSVQIRLTSKGLGVLTRLIQAHKSELELIGPDLIELLRQASSKS